MTLVRNERLFAISLRFAWNTKNAMRASDGAPLLLAHLGRAKSTFAMDWYAQDERRHHPKQTGRPIGPSRFQIRMILSDLHSEILNVHISSEAHVVRQIPAGVIRVIVNYDVVGVP